MRPAVRRALLCAGVVLAGAAASSHARSVSSLGRIEPLDGIYQLAGPSEISVVSELRVQEGDRVEKGQVLATLDTYQVRRAELKHAEVGDGHVTETCIQTQRVRARTRVHLVGKVLKLRQLVSLFIHRHHNSQVVLQRSVLERGEGNYECCYGALHVGRPTAKDLAFLNAGRVGVPAVCRDHINVSIDHQSGLACRSAMRH